MSIFESIITFLQNWKMDAVPTNYDPFHLTWIGIITVITVVLCLFFKDADDKTFRRLCLTVGLVMIFFEAIKQIMYGVHFDDGVMSWSYPWYIFPYQFCSIPMYALTLIGLSRPGAYRDSLMGCLMFFVLFAGMAAYAYPSTCFVREIYVSCQSMEHHGLQVAMGIFLVIYNRRRLSWKMLLQAVPSFVAFMGVAITLNEVIYRFVTHDTFNMFYISPHFPSTLPLMSILYNDVENPNVPWWLFIILYLIGFSVVALVMFVAERALCKVFTKKRAEIF